MIGEGKIIRIMQVITIEEHYKSERINEKIRKMISEKAPDQLPMIEGAINGIRFPGLSDFEQRLNHMDKTGILMQILSYAGGIPATMEPEYAVNFCKEVNDEFKQKIEEHQGRFKAMANLPLGNPQAAAAELERCVKELGFVGAMISGHYHGLPYDDEHYLPIFEKAAALAVPLYLHPGMTDPTVTERYYKGSWSTRTAFLFSSHGIGWHYDVGIQIVRMIMSGVFDRLPDLKIVTGHWGEVVAYYMDRLDEMNASLSLNKKISDYFKENVYVNPSGMMNAAQFRYCMETFGSKHILWGEDYPFMQSEQIVSFLEKADLTEVDREKIAYKNAEKLFKLQEDQSYEQGQ